MPSIRCLALGAAFALVSCSSAPSPRTDGAPSPVLLVSIDAFRADYLERGLTPNLSRLASEGVRARWMTPSYPTLTFPNHYTMVTGLRPDRHGIVHNTMRDPQLGTFKLSSDAVREPRWWGGEPIWVTLEKSGVRTATMFWPGSEAPIGGVRPSEWTPYDDDKPMSERVDTVLDWLSQAPSNRPRLTTLYFGELDHVSHASGPDSQQTKAAIRDVDAAIGRLFDGLSSRGLADRVNLIVVSDHGMAPVPAEHVLAAEDIGDPADVERITHGEVLGFVPRPGREAYAEARMLGRGAHHECWRKEEMPARWHYGRHPRVPPIVCQMDVGWGAIPREDLPRRRQQAVRGAHGFDPDSVEMRALFIARGPAFRPGVELAPFDNVDVYPLLARLLGVPPAPNDGDIAPLRPGLMD